MPKLIDLTGKRFGKLTIIERDMSYNRGYWKCLCDCGNYKTIRSQDIRLGKSQSCGCGVSNAAFRHGMIHCQEYAIWTDMKYRCSNPNGKHYKHYGARGITVCEQWINDFHMFLKDMGNRPSEKHSVERINVNGNYEPSNCKWATDEEQARNKRMMSRNTSGYTGVSLNKQSMKWSASICVNKKSIYLGQYEHIEDAAKVRKDAELKHWEKSS